VRDAWKAFEGSSPRRWAKNTLHYAARGITGDASPSEADMRLTRRLAEGARLLQINLLDHVIVGQPFDGRPAYFSFKEAGTI
jgi:DNA repair protein RadC